MVLIQGNSELLLGAMCLCVGGSVGSLLVRGLFHNPCHLFVFVHVIFDDLLYFGSGQILDIIPS